MEIIIVAILIFLFIFIGSRIERNQRNKYDDGYSYAAVALLSGVKTQSQLEAEIEEDADFCTNSFDRGMMKAIWDYNGLAYYKKVVIEGD